MMSKDNLGNMLDPTTTILGYIGLLIFLSILLVKSADLLEGGFVLLAKKLGISTFIIGFAVLGIASSLTEIFVAISAAKSGVPELSVGNLLGATVLLLTLVVALNTFVNKRIPFSGSFGRNQVIGALGLMILGIGAIIDERLSAFEGVILLCAYVGFVYYLSTRINHKNINHHAQVNVKKIWRLLIESCLGLIGLIVFSKLIVDAAVILSGPDLLNIPESVVGILMISIGTNIPELTILFRSKGPDGAKLAVGNFLGSACANTGILGLLAILAPHDLTYFSSIVPTILLLILAIIMFGILAWSDKEISRREAVILLSIYFLLIFAEGMTIFGY